MEPGLSILNMAEAMLHNEYKTSHTSLKSFATEEGDNSTVENDHQGGDEEESTTGFDERKRKEQIPSPRKSHDSQSDRKTEGRSVVIQEPPKRLKKSTPFSPRDVVEALNSSMSKEERLGSIYQAISTFDHDDKDAHNLEIEAGADIALVKMLAFLEFKTGFRRPPIKANLEAITKEISLTCQALEMVYRASSEAVELSFNRVGTDLMQIVVILIDEEIKARMQKISPDNSPASASSITHHSSGRSSSSQEDEESGKRSVTPPPCTNSWTLNDWDRDLMLRKASKILGHFARVGRATRPIAQFPGLLGSILNLINMRPYDGVPWEARLSCLWTIANLACNTDNMMMMICTPGLVNSLVSVGFRQLEPIEPIERTMEVLRARSIASRAILNLSGPPENKILLAENHALISMLSQLAVKRRPPYSKSKTMQDILLQARRFALGALRNLTAAPRRSKIALCEHNNGSLLDALTEVALHEPNEGIVELAFATLHNLAIHDTAEMIVAKPDLVMALKHRLLSENEGAEEDTPTSHASSTLLVLERSITPEMSSYDNLSELLDAVHPTAGSSDGQDSDDSGNDKEVVAV